MRGPVLVLRTIFFLSALTLVPSISAQTPTQKRPNFSGSWRVQYTPNLAEALGHEPPYTASRVLTSPFPFIIVQQENMIALLFEYQTLWRAIYMDGRKHPADIADYPEFMGHSIGQWEGDTLVVDTVAINERTWLDTAGHEHSAKLHLTERFRKTSDDKIEWTATFEDPVFYTKPWSLTRVFTKFDDSKDQDRILPYTCTENNRDVQHLVPNQPNLNYKYQPEKQ